MRAAFYDRLGPAREVLQVGEIPTPEPAPGEVRVQILWSGVNPSDVKSRAGVRGPNMPFPLVVPHSDGMGVIDAVGEGVSAHRVGQRVWTWNAAWARPWGTCAQYVCLPQEQAVALPDNVPDEAGACLGIPALTALHAVLMDGGVAGKRILVAGGAGSVGHYAIQMARLLGAAQVLTTVSSEHKAALALAAGADAVVRYRDESVTERVRELTQGQGVDRIIEVDIAANAALDLELLRPGGECVVYGSGQGQFNLPFFPLIARNLQLKFFIVYHLTPSQRHVAECQLRAWLKAGVLQHQIAQRFGLSDIAAAHEVVEQGKAIGNVVVGI